MAPTIRSDLVGSVHVTNELGQRLVLGAGAPVPEGYRVGDHLLDSSAAVAEASAPAPPAPPSGDGGDNEAELVAKALERNIPGVKAYAENHPERVPALLEQERAAETPRKSLIQYLEKLAAGT